MANGTLKVQNIETSSGSGTITLGQSGETVIFGSGVTTKFNQPAFEAYPSANQTIVDVTTTKVVFDSETLDTNNCFDSTTNYRFTPTVAGKYYCYSTITLATTTFPNSSMDEMRIHFYKNGTSIKRVIIDFKSNPIRYGTLDIMDTVSFNGSTDYLEVFAFIDSNTGTPMIAGSATHRPTYFGAYRIGD